MTKGRPKQKNPPLPDQVTSEDLFGDMVDAPMPGRATTPEAPRDKPFRIQVAEPGQPVKETRRGPIGILPDEVAALLDAFSGPAEEAARAEVSPPSPAPQDKPVPRPDERKPGPFPLPVPAKTGPIPLPVPAKFPALARPAGVPAKTGPLPPPPLPPPPIPVAPPASHSQAALQPEDLVDALPIEPFDDSGQELHDLNLDELTPAPPWRAKQAALPPLLPSEPPDPLHALESVPPSAAAEGRIGQPGPVPATERAALDLAAWAEDALSAPAAASPEPAAVPVPLAREQGYGPYRLIEKLAVGGMAEVFKAKRSGVEGFEKVVAVKRILAHLSENKEFVDMFINEAKMVAGLTHPNIVQTHDLGKIDKSYYIAMEYVHGRDLRTIMRRAKERGIRIPLDISGFIVSRVCAALDYAHRKKDDAGRPMRLVHRDVSPQNILISFDGDVKLTDFGIAKAASKATHTERGALRGKLLYMSPEQAWGKSMDGRSDVFSLGIVFYEMITDAKPFLASSEMSILEAVRDCRLTAPTVLNPRIPQRLERVVLKALERDPDQRYQDAADLARDLELSLGQRKPPTATELARFMEIIFDPEERGMAAPRPSEQADEEEDQEKKLEVEFDQTPGPAASALVAAGPSAAPPTKDMSIDKLLKRFGIK